MIPTIAIGDVHGLHYWKSIVAEHSDKRIIFLGDYLDPYDYVPSSQLIDNFLEIIDLKLDKPDDVVLLLGNHDVHYFEEGAISSTRYNFQLSKKINQIFCENRQLFTYAFQDGMTIFTHAGIAQQWFVDDFGGDIDANIADQLNHPLNEQQRKAIFQVGMARGGLSAKGGIMWADMSELRDPLHGYTQVVGHNRVGKVTERPSPVPNTKIIFCDCLRNGNYLCIDEH